MRESNEIFEQNMEQLDDYSVLGCKGSTIMSEKGHYQNNDMITGVRLHAKAVNFLLKTWAPELIYEALEAMDLDHPNPVGFIMTYGANHTRERNPKFKLDTSKMLKR